MQTKIENIGGLIIDMDGVLWHGNNALPGLSEFFALLRSVKLPFVLATNNASLTQTQYIDKLASMSVEVSADEVLTSSMATARYLKENLPDDKKRVFVIGEAGLRHPLEEQGFSLTDLIDLKPTHPDESVDWADVVVSGLDRKLTWDKLATATLNLNHGALFYATNADSSLPTERGEVMGNGGVLAALTSVTGKAPRVIGKPEPILYQQAFEILGTEKHNTIAIGDRLNTDILGAVNAGIRSLMVLTGVSTASEVDDLDYGPDWILPDLPAITAALEASLK
ncbi:putative sugar phosphatase of HAD superfamily [Methylophaga frappieri]|uniref:Putative sugar phosphatase of HAD superfamily n=1 Tax=Methylophaga frappieri (strain ATCC BAA-2434 / DSM 25690 / JAM7) TaxID=754477 RepID=I1YIT1_METFJ|nr:HAD-IIA family hydrolase [Methylophaga frappieri]AFJ02824.1 putative sugar phosphatase of HAD superfamily [Methylophaga frappieri]